MKKGRLLLRTAGLLAAIAMTAVFGLASGVEEPKPSGGARADVIAIDTMKMFGDLERPKVVFLHDLHTDALAKKNKDCAACHLSGKSFEMIPDTLKDAVKGIDVMSPKFKRIKNAGRKEVMDIYHAECIGCHTDMTADGEKAGPMVCGECHQKTLPPAVREPMGLDKSLHFRHSKAHENKCEKCHHEFDEKTKQLVYVKEKEGSCRYCHKEETQENRISMPLASHLACISCHRSTLAEKKKTGPVKCSGCHDPAQRAVIAKAEDIKRMERKQPDVVLLRTLTENEADANLIARMSPVPFAHKAHEEYNDTCRVCHHESLDSCGKCHTLEGKKEGKGVKLERAMHRTVAEESCMGCHEKKQDDKKCAGCHVLMGKKQKPEPASCQECHIEVPAPPVQEGVEPQPLEKKSKEELAALANEMLQARKGVSDTFTDEDIPEKIIIKDLMKKYEAVEFPHRKIVKTLVNGMKENKLANFFHREEGTMCQGCHHNSPASKKPPRCGNCHGKPFEQGDMFKPGRMGAYHIQCMGCHKEMGIEKPMGCTECHKEKTS